MTPEVQKITKEMAIYRTHYEIGNREVEMWRPNTPEIREYRACFWDGGKSKGEWSPVVSVSVI